MQSWIWWLLLLEFNLHPIELALYHLFKILLFNILARQWPLFAMSGKSTLVSYIITALAGILSRWRRGSKAIRIVRVPFIANATAMIPNLADTGGTVEYAPERKDVLRVHDTSTANDMDTATDEQTSNQDKEQLKAEIKSKARKKNEARKRAKTRARQVLEAAGKVVVDEEIPGGDDEVSVLAGDAHARPPLLARWMFFMS